AVFVAKLLPMSWMLSDSSVGRFRRGAWFLAGFAVILAAAAWPLGHWAILLACRARAVETYSVHARRPGSAARATVIWKDDDSSPICDVTQIISIARSDHVGSGCRRRRSESPIAAALSSTSDPGSGAGVKVNCRDCADPPPGPA